MTITISKSQIQRASKRLEKKVVNFLANTERHEEEADKASKEEIG